MKTLAPLVLGLSIVSGSALAQSMATTPGSLPIHYVDFDMWCQEQQHLPPERCDQRLAEDDQAYQAYINRIAPYEEQHLKDRQSQEQVGRDILHNDPVDRPTRPSTPSSEPPPNVPPQ